MYIILSSAVDTCLRYSSRPREPQELLKTVIPASEEAIEYNRMKPIARESERKATSDVTRFQLNSRTAISAGKHVAVVGHSAQGSA